MLVKQILTQLPTTTDRDATILSISEMMREDETGAVLVLDDDRLVGIVTDRDIAIQLSTPDTCALERPVSQIMTHDPVTCTGDQDVVDAAALMADYQVRRLPVLDRNGHIIGLLTVDAIAEHFSEHVAGETLGEIVEERLRKPLRPNVSRHRFK